MTDRGAGAYLAFGIPELTSRANSAPESSVFGSPYDLAVLSVEELDRRLSPGARRRRQRRLAAARLRRVVVVTAVLAIGICGCGGSGPSGRARVAVHHVSLDRLVTITVEASGDLLIHSPVWERAQELGGGSDYNFAPLFARIRPIIKGVDLALCHVETPMTPAPPQGYPMFNTPPELASAIHQTGFRACSTAATHTLDEGQTGINDTNRALDRAGVLHTGGFSAPAAQRTPLTFTVKGVRVAFLSYTELTNGIPSPHPWSVNRASAPQILADAHRARQAGAQVVIVNIHWGDEDVSKPSTFQLKLAKRLTRSPDVTAIVGQHVHVPQPIRKINGKLVVFGEGNLISNQTPACCATASQDGLLAILTIVVDGNRSHVTFVHYVPIWVEHPSYTVLPVATGLRTDAADATALRASFNRTVAVAGRTRDIQPIPVRLP